jgi:hypothetical protein
MWPLTTFTLGFRGIMVIHRVETEDPNYFEVGVVDDPLHSLKINTIKNGMLAETAFINKPEVGAIWTLEVDNPIASGVNTYTRGSDEFDRQRHQDERDYRWLTDLGELFPGIEDELITDGFAPVLRIYNGVFSTRVKSPELSKIVDGASHFFGSIAAVVACDIPMLAGQVRLVDQSTGDTLFTFEPDEDTIYEFANTPGEVLHDETEHDELHDPGEHGSGEPGSDDDDDEEDPCRFDHFKSYYRLFPRPENKPVICFKKVSGHPAPDPATCGAAGIGGRRSPFGGS